MALFGGMNPQQMSLLMSGMGNASQALTRPPEDRQQVAGMSPELMNMIQQQRAAAAQRGAAGVAEPTQPMGPGGMAVMGAGPNPQMQGMIAQQQQAFPPPAEPSFMDYLRNLWSE